jgi:hypothetical protein
MASSRTNRTAKLFSSKTSTRLPIVLGSGLRSQRSKRSLSLSSAIGAFSRHFFLHFFFLAEVNRPSDERPGFPGRS